MQNLVRQYKAGDSIGGRFAVEAYQHGGHGDIYFCYDYQEHGLYVLKTIRQGTAFDFEFNREIDVWIELKKHPNIVQCFGIETVEHTRFLVMEWVGDNTVSQDITLKYFKLDLQKKYPNFLEYENLTENQPSAINISEKKFKSNLAEWLVAGALDLKFTLSVAIDICVGLNYAYDRPNSIVHRDLKPDNILITEQRRAKITDFGIAIITHIDALENETRLRGTAYYRAPEQWRGERVDTRSDIYAIGCIIYEMLRGQKAFAGFDKNEMRAAHEHGPIPALPAQFPPHLNRIVQQCLAKERYNRFSSPANLLAELCQLYQELFAEPPPGAQNNEALIKLSITDYNRLGGAHDELRNYEQSLNYYNEALQLTPDDPATYHNRGNTYSRLGKFDQAIQDYTKALSLQNVAYRGANWGKELIAKTLNCRGLAYHEQQRYADALRDFSKAINQNPQYHKAYLNRSITYSTTQRLNEAAIDLSKLIDLRPEYVDAYIYRSLIYAQLSRFKGAFEDLREASELVKRDIGTTILIHKVYAAIYEYIGNPLFTEHAHSEATTLEQGLQNLAVNTRIDDIQEMALMKPSTTE